jgi:hypothetical protein
MALYARLLGQDDAGEAVDFKIPLHAFEAIVAEFARGQLTGAAANAIVAEVSGALLSASEITEITTLYGTISGTATAKLARAREIDNVLLLGEHDASGYNRPALVKTRLGV